MKLLVPKNIIFLRLSQHCLKLLKLLLNFNISMISIYIIAIDSINLIAKHTLYKSFLGATSEPFLFPSKLHQNAIHLVVCSKTYTIYRNHKEDVQLSGSGCAEIRSTIREWRSGSNAPTTMMQVGWKLKVQVLWVIARLVNLEEFAIYFLCELIEFSKFNFRLPLTKATRVSSEENWIAFRVNQITSECTWTQRGEMKSVCCRSTLNVTLVLNQRWFICDIWLLFCFTTQFRVIIEHIFWQLTFFMSPLEKRILVRSKSPHETIICTFKQTETIVCQFWVLMTSVCVHSWFFVIVGWIKKTPFDLCSEQTFTLWRVPKSTSILTKRAPKISLNSNPLEKVIERLLWQLCQQNIRVAF